MGPDGCDDTVMQADGAANGKNRDLVEGQQSKRLVTQG